MWDHTHRIEAKGGTFRSPNLLVAFEILDELGSRLRPLTTSTVSGTGLQLMPERVLQSFIDARSSEG